MVEVDYSTMLKRPADGTGTTAPMGEGMTGEELVQQENVRRLSEALCALGSPDDAVAFLLDLCTPREIADLAQRLEVAELLADGQSYLSVSKATGASSTTVSRVSKCLNGTRGGYRRVIGLLRERRGE